MYTPTHYKEDRTELFLNLIHQDGFATLLTEGDSALVTHVPMVFSEGVLYSHMARANPHWRKLAEVGRAKALFHGPHAYISPAWYQPKSDNVPTWNYAVVHVSGDFEVLENEAYEIMSKMVQHFETKSGTGWELPSDSGVLDQLMKAIVVFRLSNLSFEGKFKLSQKQDSLSRKKVILELESRAPDLASLMKET